VRDKRRFSWLILAQSGLATSEIARQARCSKRLVEHSLAEAMAESVAFADKSRLLRPPPLYLIFPINGLFPSSTCNHDRVPLPDGTLACCSVCARSGRDNHPALARFPLTDPRPDPPLPTPKPEHVTRRQKRARLRDHRGARASVSA